MSITVSAPGKLLLMGDHAVVYGYPCIVTAISERLTVRVSAESASIDTRFLDAAVKLWGKDNTKLSATSSFSGRYGFGSSSAVTVAALKALRPDADNRIIFDAAYQIVLDIQKVGSGFDVAAATYGGTIYYVKSKTIEPLTISSMPIVIGYTGVKADTVTLVQQIAKKREQEKEKVEKIFAAIGHLVDDGKKRMLEGDWKRVGRLIDFNQEYLRDLGVSSEKLEALIGAAKKAGAYGAKLSGAGGGDCMIAVVPEDKRQAVEEAIVHAGGEVMKVTPNAPGVRVETTDNQNEMFIVVDESDNIIGYKTRYECHHDKTLIHRTVGALIFNDKGQLLLQKRSQTKDMEAGLWGISAAGHVTQGQTDDEAVHRELQEELGINAPLTFVCKFITRNDMETESAALFKGIHNGPFTPDDEEVDEVRFFDPREIKLFVVQRKLILTDAALQSLREVGLL